MKKSFLPFSLYLLTGILFITSSCSKKLIPDKPFLSQSNFRLDSLPYSEINIPVQINLKPLFLAAEKSVDTLFTSPGWPDGWVESGCDTRYKYQFRRGPLSLKAYGNKLDIDFTGFYKIIGSTRLCVGNAVLSPWTAPCSCGFREGDRRVNVGFTAQMNVLPDFRIVNSILRKEPVPVDKCNVCFWGQDITKLVMKGMAEELDLSKKAMEDSFSLVNLKPQIQDLWNMVESSYKLNGLGWLKINPQNLHLNSLEARNDSLNVELGLTARPVVSFEEPGNVKTLLPDMINRARPSGFTIFLDAVLNYDSLSRLLNAQLIGKTFDFKKGPVKKKVVVREASIYGTGNEKLIIKIDFTGSVNGIAYLPGKPYYDARNEVIGIRDMDFDVKTRAALVKTAEWLFNRKIIREIEENASFSLSAYIDSAVTVAASQMNREWTNGIRSSGQLDKLTIIGIYPLSSHLVIRSNAAGKLAIKVDSLEF